MTSAKVQSYEIFHSLLLTQLNVEFAEGLMNRIIAFLKTSALPKLRIDELRSLHSVTEERKKLFSKKLYLKQKIGISPEVSNLFYLFDKISCPCSSCKLCRHWFL